MTRYRTIVADPPWRYTQKPTERTGAGVSAEHVYTTMTTEQIAALPIGDLAADDAHLYMWVTNPVLLGMRPTIMGELSPPDIARAWGFEPAALLTWIKSESGAGMGWYFRGDTEHVIFAVRGDAAIDGADRISNVFRGQRGAHSAKPDSFLDRVESVSPGPYVECFARRARFGWDYWGDQSLSTAAMADA